MIDRFVAFYPFPPFWALESVDFQNLEISTIIYDLMSEIKFKYKGGLFQLQICRDGMVMLQVFEIESEAPIAEEGVIIVEPISFRGRYTDYLNCLYLILDSSINDILRCTHFEFTELTIRDTIRISLKDGEFSSASLTGFGNTPNCYNMRFIHKLEDLPLPDRVGLERPVFTKQVFDDLVVKLELVFADRTLLTNMSILAKSYSEFRIGNLELSLVLSWFIIERMLNNKWKQFLDSKNQEVAGGAKRINSKRKEKFIKDRDYPISVISNILELSDIISYELFQKIDKVRGFRNAIIHQDAKYSCQLEDCIMALDLAEKIGFEDHSLNISFNKGSYPPCI